MNKTNNDNRVTFERSNALYNSTGFFCTEDTNNNEVANPATIGVGRIDHSGWMGLNHETFGPAGITVYLCTTKLGGQFSSTEVTQIVRVKQPQP